MLKKDKVDFITDVLGSNPLLAVYQQIVQSNTILISANSGCEFSHETLLVVLLNARVEEKYYGTATT